ncbi:MAG: DMT family transporter [Desulfuromonadaceae bacterium]|nr:DMT family transporter [Desulfuromonadaceae bacterium]MDD5106592.1 DMT family transporter [Desulfuromonadaceae bacterium]
MNKYKAALLLLTTTFFWGITFTIVKQAIETVDVFVFLAQRFIFAFLLILPVCWKMGKGFDVNALRQGAVMGIFLFGAYAFQTVALLYTTASNTGFLTGLNVVIVPIISALMLKQQIPRSIMVAVTLSALGLFLLCSNGGSLAINSGDLMAAVCALFVALHLIYTGEYARKSDYYWLTAIQLGMVALLSTITALATGKQVFVWHPQLLSTLIICSLIATVFAFLVQTSMQRYISHTNTALIFCTEPAFAALYAWLIIGERFGLAGLIGAILIMSGMVISILPSHGGRVESGTDGEDVRVHSVDLDEYRIGE